MTFFLSRGVQQRLYPHRNNILLSSIVKLRVNLWGTKNRWRPLLANLIVIRPLKAGEFPWTLIVILSIVFPTICISPSRAKGGPRKRRLCNILQAEKSLPLRINAASYIPLLNLCFEKSLKKHFSVLPKTWGLKTKILLTVAPTILTTSTLASPQSLANTACTGPQVLVGLAFVLPLGQLSSPLKSRF